MEISIRPFGKEDRALVEQFFSQMGYESRVFFNQNDYNHKRAIRYFNDSQDQHTQHWMAVTQERMVGYVFLWNTQKGVVELGIAVADDLKGKRLGEKLIDTAKSWCVAHGKGGILLTTHPANLRAQALHLRCGFNQIGISNNRGEFLYLYNFPMSLS